MHAASTNQVADILRFNNDWGDTYIILYLVL